MDEPHYVVDSLAGHWYVELTPQEAAAAIAEQVNPRSQWHDWTIHREFCGTDMERCWATKP